jgi:hydroxymethylpyrimidine pyrophosphatase-like HAD family hydrolase
MAERRKISLVLADVDGTLVDEQKVLTKRTQDAVRAMRKAGIRFAITSGRPPLGMSMLFDPLDLDTPIAGFNGGLFVARDLKILTQKTVPADVARQAIDLIRDHDLDVWVYSGNDWLITKPGAPHVKREAWTVKFEPKVVTDFGDLENRIAKIVGISDDRDRVQRCLGVPAEEIATIGDQPNDVLMFKRSGFSIAMGNASDEVKGKATAVTDSYNDEGFAKAMERFILGSMT